MRQFWNYGTGDTAAAVSVHGDRVYIQRYNEQRLRVLNREDGNLIEYIKCVWTCVCLHVCVCACVCLCVLERALGCHLMLHLLMICFWVASLVALRATALATRRRHSRRCMALLQLSRTSFSLVILTTTFTGARMRGCVRGCVGACPLCLLHPLTCACGAGCAWGGGFFFRFDLATGQYDGVTVQSSRNTQMMGFDGQNVCVSDTSGNAQCFQGVCVCVCVCV